jgi:hypothetical protein
MVIPNADQQGHAMLLIILRSDQDAVFFVQAPSDSFDGSFFQ